jgi:hypothetical protein
MACDASIGFCFRECSDLSRFLFEVEQITNLMTCNREGLEGKTLAIGDKKKKKKKKNILPSLQAREGALCRQRAFVSQW